MTISKIFSGLNENALKFLLPTWMSAYTGVVLRLGGGTLLFWIYGLITKQKSPKITNKDRILLFITGMISVFGYMWTLLEGLTYTTPISSSIFISLQPIWVFIICLILRTEKISIGKTIGILLGFAGALMIILTQKSSSVALDPIKGNIYCLASSILFAAYLVIEKVFLRHLSNAQVSKWTFFGGAFSASVVILFTGWDAPVLSEGIFSTPMLALLFVILFPTFLSYLLQDIGLKNLPATVVALYGDLILIVAAIASYILGQDKFDWWQPVAIVLMLISVYLVEVAEKKGVSAKYSESDRRKIK